ncbi:MAG: response regulator [Nitrospinae bacterium]|nr:response regulator [Nitrospinota bacterium]
MESVLIVDDEAQAASTIRKILAKKGYDASEAHNGVEALEFLSRNRVEVILLDIRMPVMGGVEALELIKKQYPDTEVIMITAIVEMATAVDCLKKGAYGYLSKPLSVESLLMEITQAIERRKLSIENRDYQRNLEVKVKERTQEVQKLFGLLEENYFKTILMFVDLMELRDPFLGGHSKRVALLAARTGKKFNKDERWLQDLEVAGLLHDIGTLGLPEKTLKTARDKLSEAELELLSNQTLVSQETLSAIERLKNPARIIRSHMEWIDGHGFPDGLKDEQIPIESKILAVANAYDEVKNRRRFNVEPMASHVSDEARAISHLKEHAGKHFDRKVVEKFIETIEEIILAQKGAYVVSIADLNEGMTLAEDLTADNGTLLLAKGNRLSNLLITKIRNYSKMVSLISMKILVYQKAQIKTP